ncbi:proline-rich protein 27 isoform X2 [Peromyscus maniculatus bairdii]|uniref:proline-rich protein 27 isoform X2 n=1 Tax=Peromyscus maniculatus bairdii TaxID=230844 RepID=UPI003FD09B66
MKLLLWACVMCVAFAKRRRYPFIYKKSPSPSEEDYYGNRYPLTPSLNIPFGLWNDNLPPFLLPPLDAHQGNAITKFSGNPEAERGLTPYPWIPTSSKVRYIYQNPNYPTDPAAAAPPPPPPVPPPRAYPFVIPPKISVSSVAAEPAAAPPAAAPPVGEGLVPEFSMDKTISGLPPAIKLEPPPAEPKPPASEPALGQFGAGAPETAPAQFGGLEPAPAPSGAAEPAATHPMIPEPAPPQSVAAAQAIPGETPADQSAENKPASGREVRFSGEESFYTDEQIKEI